MTNQAWLTTTTLTRTNYKPSLDFTVKGDTVLDRGFQMAYLPLFHLEIAFGQPLASPSLVSSSD